MALRSVRSTGSRTKPASASPRRSASGASAADTATSSSGTSGSRSRQIRTHFAGVTPGTYASLNEEGASEPVTGPDYRAWSGAAHMLDILDA